jgi:hypothetical protein
VSLLGLIVALLLFFVLISTPPHEIGLWINHIWDAGQQVGQAVSTHLQQASK